MKLEDILKLTREQIVNLSEEEKEKALVVLKEEIERLSKRK